MENYEIYKKYLHKPTGYEYLMIGGEDFYFGYDDDQIDFIKNNFDYFDENMFFNKQKNINICRFLVCSEPIRQKSVKNILSIDESDEFDEFAVSLDYKSANKYVNYYNLNMISELQYEYMLKKNLNGFFAWGNSISDLNAIEPWMRYDLDKSAVTKRGFKGLYFPSWTKDDYRYENDVRVSDSLKGKVMKGGGAYFWPWQDNEWIWCMPSFYYSSSEMSDQELGISPMATIRPAISIEKYKSMKDDFVIVS